MATSKPNFVYTGLKNVPADVSSFPILAEGGSGMQMISIPPGKFLTPHWHPNSSETTYCVSGTGKVGIVYPDPTEKEPIGATFSKPLDFNGGDIVFLPQGSLHYFKNPSSRKDDLVLLLTFSNPDFDILTLADSLQDLPSEVVKAAESSIGSAGSSPIVPKNCP